MLFSFVKCALKHILEASIGERTDFFAIICGTLGCSLGVTGLVGLGFLSLGFACQPSQISVWCLSGFTYRTESTLGSWSRKECAVGVTLGDRLGTVSKWELPGSSKACQGSHAGGTCGPPTWPFTTFYSMASAHAAVSTSLMVFLLLVLVLRRHTIKALAESECSYSV